MNNIIIAGIGGQGINSLALVLSKVLHSCGLACQYTVHKGGAQSLGSVYVEMRLHKGCLPTLAAAIPEGKLDFLVALDPWEALRHLHKAHTATKTWVESNSMPLFSERNSEKIQAMNSQNPLQQLSQCSLPMYFRHYQRDALVKFGTSKMANYIAGLDCLDALDISNTSLFKQVFFSSISGATAHKRNVSL